MVPDVDACRLGRRTGSKIRRERDHRCRGIGDVIRIIQRSEIVDMKLEVVTLPVSDVDRAKTFYKELDWREDADFIVNEGFRIVQLTPPGSECSVVFGEGLTTAEPGSMQGLILVVNDLEGARSDLLDRGIDVSEVFHDAEGAFHHSGTGSRVTGPDAKGRSYFSFASFSDSEGNGWLLQEVKTRAPGR
jgi:catechol 2,3-dioxygenase-like lactoylglutathione lyase family enzyme